MLLFWLLNIEVNRKLFLFSLLNLFSLSCCSSWINLNVLRMVFFTELKSENKEELVVRYDDWDLKLSINGLINVNVKKLII